MRRVRDRRQRGQALTELALVLPILFGFVAVTMQGGLVISDQVNLQHAAYEGAQWAIANRTSTDKDDVKSHIKAQLCGNGVSIGSASALTRYCRDNSLSINVTKGATATSMGGGPSLLSQLGLVQDALAAGCQRWDVNVPSSITVAQGSSYNLTVSLTGITGSGSPPLVTPSISGLPKYLSNGTPQFNPPTTAGSSVIKIAPSINTQTTPPGSYTLHVGGIDQCGGEPLTATSQGPGKDITLNVTSGGGPGTLPLSVALQIDGLFPVCIPLGSPQTFTVNGANFATGASFVLGSGSGSVSGSVTVVSSTQLVVTIPAIPTSGVLDGTVQNPDGSSYTIANAVTVASSCPNASPSANPATLSGASTPCQGTSAGTEYQYTITITWNETLVIPWLTSAVPLTAVQKTFCQ